MTPWGTVLDKTFVVIYVHKQVCGLRDKDLEDEIESSGVLSLNKSFWPFIHFDTGLLAIASAHTPDKTQTRCTSQDTKCQVIYFSSVMWLINVIRAVNGILHKLFLVKGGAFLCREWVWTVRFVTVSSGCFH